MRFGFCLLLSSLWIPPLSAALGVEPDQQAEQVRLDRYDDPLPKHAIARLGSARFLPDHETHFLAYSPNGKFLSTITSSSMGSNSPSLQIWDVATGRAVAAIALRDDLYRAAWSPDGRQIAICAKTKGLSGTLEIWDVSGFKLRHRLGGNANYRCLAWSPDGKQVVAASLTDRISIWDAETGKQRGNLDSFARCVDFSPDGQLLAVGSTGIAVWNLAKREVVRKMPKVKQKAQASAKELLDATPHNLPDQPVIRHVEPSSIDFAPDGRSIAFAADGMGRWHLRPGRDEVSFHQEFFPYQLKHSGDGSKLVGSIDACQVWNVQTKKKLGEWSNCWAGAFSPDGKRLALATRRISFVDGESLRDIVRFEGHRNGVTHLAIAPDGNTIVSGGMGETVRVWDLEQSREKRTLAGSSTFALARDGKTLAVCTVTIDKKSNIVLWNVETGKRLGHLDGSANYLAFSPTDDTLVSIDWTSSDRGTTLVTTRFWDIAKRRQIKEFSETIESFWISKVVFSPNGKFMAQNFPTSGRIQIRNMKTGDIVRTIEHDPFDFSMSTRPVNFSADAQRVLGENFEIDLATGRRWPRFVGKEDGIEVKALAFSPDGVLSATAIWDWKRHDNKVLVFSTATGRQLVEFTGHHGQIREIEFTPDGERLVTACEDSTLLVWDLGVAKRALTSAEKQVQPADINRAEVKALRQACQDKDWHVRYESIVALGILCGRYDEFWPEAVVAAMSDQDERVRLTAAKIVASWENLPSELAPLLLKCAKSSDAKVRASAMLPLARAAGKSPKVMAILQSASKDLDPMVNFNAVSGIFEATDDLSLVVPQWMLFAARFKESEPRNSPTHMVALRSAFALHQFSEKRPKEMCKTLVKLVKGDEPRMRQLATSNLRAMARNSDKAKRVLRAEGVPALLRKLCNDSDPEVSWRAASALLEFEKSGH